MKINLTLKTEENSNAIQEYWKVIQEYSGRNPWRRGATLPIADSGSNLAAVAWNGKSGVHLRVYYQAPDLTLKEHCYERGWFEGK